MAPSCEGVKYFRLLDSGTDGPAGHYSSSSSFEKLWFPLSLTTEF